MTAVPALDPVEVVSLATRRFGEISVSRDQLITFPHGLPGFETLTGFVLLPVRPGLAWLQSTERSEVAFLLVAPHHVEPDAWATLDGAWAIVTLGRSGDDATANLLAPICIDTVRQQGRQEIRPESGFGTAHPLDLSRI